MWTAPSLQEMSKAQPDRLRSYVRSVDAVAHDRCQDGLRDASSKHERDLWSVRPLDPSECLASWDRSITPSAFLKQASALDVRVLRTSNSGYQKEIGIISGTSVVEDQGFVSPAAALSCAEARVVKAGRRPPPQAAQRGLDGARPALNCRLAERSRRACAGDGIVRR
jgi:hypothetical protein